MEIERKTITIGSVKSVSDEGILTGYGAVFGNVDLQGDVIAPGAFEESIQDFIADGYLMADHDWQKRIGTIETAREDTKGLYFEAKFHTTAFAQEFKKVIKERIERGKKVALSIGYKVLQDSPLSKGVRQLQKLKLYEISVVTVGANSLATAAGMKAGVNKESVMSAEVAGVDYDYKSEIEGLRSTVEALTKERNKPLRPNFGGHPAGYSREAEQKSIGEQFIESREFKNFRPTSGAESESVTFNIDIKTLMTTTTAPPETTRSGLLVPSAQIQPNVLDMIPRVRTTQNAHIYLEETTYTNAVSTVLEGGLKPEVTLGLTEKTAAIRKIAGYVPITDETLEDTPAVMDYVNNRLALMCAQKLEAQVLSGDGINPNILGIYATPGILTQVKSTDATPDAIRKAITQIRVTGKGQANGIIIHPNDWQEIQLLRTTDGIYIWGNPWEAGLDRVWGLPVLQSDAAVEGTAIVADFRFTLLIYRKEFTIKIGYSGDDWLRNRRSVIGELRAGFVVLRPSCVCTVSGI